MQSQSLVLLEGVNWTYPNISRHQRTLKDLFVKSLSKKRRVKAYREPHLNDITLSLGPGERVGVVGPNGAGKSSLLRLISGVLTPDSGVIKVSGKVTPLMNLGSTLVPQISCRKNIILALCAMGCNRKEAHFATNEILEWSELIEFSEEPFFSLSAGMQSRLLFAISTSQRPDIILLDELLSVGDSRFVQKARERLESFVSSGSILIAVSHDLQTLERMTTNVIWMQKGRIYKYGPSDVVLRDYETSMMG